MKKQPDFYANLESFLQCKDYTVSEQLFDVKRNHTYDMLVTFPVPKNLEDYYKSEKYISHTDSKKGFFDKIYQFVKNYTLQKKVDLINSFGFENKSILDVGAGTGDFLKVCLQNNWTVFGTEPNQKAREIAKQKQLFLKNDLQEFSNKKFDVITLWHVLEHVENVSEFISQLKNLLSENGKLIVAVPNFKSDDAKHYKEFWAAYDVPRHLWHFSQKSIHLLFENENMSVQKILPMKFDSFYVSMLSEKYKTGKLNFLIGFWRGFVSNWKARKTSEYSSLIYIIKKD
ncbi:class I SAM-dependent methyltransferase [Polaribacter sp. BAL334]|uniref:class I SAM-dependent methyltransferase n=1 Tax=Polaribacter sp. BAL334 TaxID=1708178 RepID=UPI0018D23DA5|nr:class I SAM-dependent methyltransferase [Polaribacter sp. BAL334]MBG7611951.1 class I SAM-dependent methyltransferase [Polaribacter sp. BAL334]